MTMVRVSDISKYQSRNLRPNTGSDAWDPANWVIEIDWDLFLLSTQSPAVVIIRVGDGLHLDPCFYRYLEAIKQRGKPWGIYHLQRAGENISQQVELIRQWCPEMPPAGVWADFEFTGGLSGATLFDACQAYLFGLDDAYGRTTGIYSGAWFLNPNISVERQRQWSQRPGWWSGYPSLIIPRGWQGTGREYVLHQNTNRYSWPGMPRPADHSYLNPALTLADIVMEPTMVDPLIAYGSKIGLHAIRNGMTLPLVISASENRIPWPVVKSGAGNAGLLVDIKRYSPDTITIFRRVYDPSANGVETWSDERMTQEAAAAIAYVADNLNAEERAAIDRYEVLNEDDPPGVAGYRALGRYMIFLIAAANQRGIKLILPAFNFGTPEWDEMIALVETGVFGAMKIGGHWLAVHEAVDPFSTTPYTVGPIPGAPFVPGAGPHAWRYRYLYRLLMERGEIVPLVISEFYAGLGYDLGNVGHILARFAEYDTQVRQDSYVLAFLPYTIDPDDAWRHQDYTSFFVYPAMSEYRQREAAVPNATNPPPEPLPGEEPMTQADRDYLREQALAAQAALDNILNRLDLLNPPLPWWEVVVPPYVLPAQNKALTFWRSNGEPFSPSITRNVTWPMNVFERSGILLRVTDNVPAGTSPAEPWWVRANDVIPP